MVEKQIDYRKAMKGNRVQELIKYWGVLIFGLAVFSSMFLWALEYTIVIFPLQEEIVEYQRSIEPDMITSIHFNEHYEAPSLVTDWKLDELAAAMANAQSNSPDHPEGFGRLTIEMDTTGTEIYPNVELMLAYEWGVFVTYFRLQMGDEKSDIAVKFVGQDLNNWARSVGIANKEDWRYYISPD